MFSEKERFENKKEGGCRRCEQKPQHQPLFEQIVKHPDPAQKKQCQMDDEDRLVYEDQFADVSKEHRNTDCGDVT